MNLLKCVIFFIHILICVTKCVSWSDDSIISNDLFKKITEFYTLKSDDVLSGTCREQAEQYFLALTANPPKMWAYKMFDASSKMQSGILAGNFRDLGAFDQCLSIENIVSNNVTVSGKHCYATLAVNLDAFKNETTFKEQQNNFLALTNLLGAPINKMGIENEMQTRNMEAGVLMAVGLKWSICVPDACSAEQIQEYVQKQLFGENGTISFLLDESNCQTPETIKPKLRTADWVFVGFLIVILFLLISSTVYDIYLQIMQRRAPHPILLSFSILANGKRLIAVNKSPEQLPCLHGMRWFSMMWVVLGHRYSATAFEPNVNAFYVLEWQQKFLSQLQFGSTVSVDTFFMLSGCLLMYGFLKSMTKKIPFNIPLFYLNRYLRLTPALAVLIAFYVTILQYMGSGPRWPSVAKMHKEGCENHWWKVLLYIQNYENHYHKEPQTTGCVGQAWYLAVDMQLFWLSPLILLPVWYFKRFARLILSALVTIFTVVPIIIAYRYKLTLWGLAVAGEGTIHDVYYAQTHTRAGTWLVGLCLGYALFYTRAKKISINKFISTGLWMLSTIVALYVLFGLYPVLQEGYVYKRWGSSMFIGLHRVAWCIALSWVVFACVHGYGGPANWILSLPMFQVLGRFTYSMYLTHMVMQSMRGGVARSPGHFSNLDVWYIYWGDLLFCLIISIVWVLAFESPVGVISNILLGGAKKPRVSTGNPRIQTTEETVVTTGQETVDNNNNSTVNEHLPPRISIIKEDLTIDISTGNENSALDVTAENLQPTNSRQDDFQIHHRNINSENKE